MEKTDYAIIAGDLQNFLKELGKIESTNTIINKHISTQIAEVPNPNYMPGITGASPKTITTIIVSALIEFQKKEFVNPKIN